MNRKTSSSTPKNPVLTENFDATGEIMQVNLFLKLSIS
jgi:hypothetical protein